MLLIFFILGSPKKADRESCRMLGVGIFNGFSVKNKVGVKSLNTNQGR